jgi:pimeloyl-ACP methyl ester carboxylesterase
MAYGSLRLIRPFVKAAAHLAPRMTGNAAFRLFCTPPRLGSLDKAQRDQITRAEARLSQAERRRVAYPGGEVETYLFKTAVLPVRGRVLLLHGWTGRAAFMSAFVHPLVSAGFDVLAVDLPAHGHSSGKTLHVPRAVAALHAVHAKLGPWSGIVAHSFGGAVAACLVADAVEGFPPIPVDSLVLIAAPNSIPSLFHWFGSTIGLTFKAQHWFDANVQRLAGRGLQTFIGADFLHASAVRTLVLHAPDDKEVDFANAEAFAAAGDNVTLMPLAGLGHRRILYASATVKAVTLFLAGADAVIAASAAAKDC